MDILCFAVIVNIENAILLYSRIAIFAILRPCSALHTIVEWYLIVLQNRNKIYSYISISVIWGMNFCFEIYKEENFLNQKNYNIFSLFLVYYIFIWWKFCIKIQFFFNVFNTRLCAWIFLNILKKYMPGESMQHILTRKHT